MPGGYSAVVTVQAGGQTQTQLVRSGSSYLAAHDPRLSFGLGAATRVDAVTVRWPDGRTEERADVAANQFLRFRIGSRLSPGGRQSGR